MIIKAEFEEKSFEAAVNSELHQGAGYIYSPGQHAETKLGYDVSFYIPSSHNFWQFFEFVVGQADDVLAKILSKRGIQYNQISPCNLFIQYKRADFISRGKGPQLDAWNGESFLKIKLLKHQHRVLRYQEEKLKKGLVTYMAPRFYKFVELQTNTANKTCLVNSFFVRPSQLDEHTKYVTYQKTGMKFYHFSEPKLGHADNFFEMLKITAEQNIKNGVKVNELINDYYNFIPKLINDVFDGNEDLINYLNTVTNSIDDNYSLFLSRRIDKDQSFRKYLIGNAMAHLFGFDWYLIWIAW